MEYTVFVHNEEAVFVAVIICSFAKRSVSCSEAIAAHIVDGTDVVFSHGIAHSFANAQVEGMVCETVDCCLNTV